MIGNLLSEGVLFRLLNEDPLYFRMMKSLSRARNTSLDRLALLSPSASLLLTIPTFEPLNHSPYEGGN
jgi:hypothetical protein